LHHNLTLGRENKRIFQAKLPLPWVRDVRQKKRKIKKKNRKKKNQSIKDLRKAKENENKKEGSLDKTMSEQCAELSKDKI